MSKDRVIIDGYNVLHAHPIYGSMAREDLDGARSRLVSDLAGFAQGGPSVIVVFDGGGNPLSDGKPEYIGALAVVFSPFGKDADTVIEALAQRFRERAERVTVVTSDSATRFTVRSGTVSVLTSENFIQQLIGDAAARTEANEQGRRRTHVSERVAPDVRAILSRWAKGELSDDNESKPSKR